MVTPEQAQIVHGSILYWIEECSRTGLTIPFLCAVSELTPKEVLEAVIEVSFLRQDKKALLAYCGEIREPILSYCNTGPRGYGFCCKGELIVNTERLTDYMDVCGGVESILEVVLKRAQEDYDEEHETKEYSANSETFCWRSLPYEEKVDWRNAVRAFLEGKNKVKGRGLYEVLYDEEAEFHEELVEVEYFDENLDDPQVA